MTKETQKAKVLNFLKMGLKLNPLVAQREFGCIGSTLAYYIHELRNEGWDIQTDVKQSAYNKSRYAEYHLPASWRLVSECEKRAAMKAKSKKVSLKSLRLFDKVKTNEGLKGYVEALYESGLVIIKDKTGDSFMCHVSDIAKRLRY